MGLLDSDLDFFSFSDVFRYQVLNFYFFQFPPGLVQPVNLLFARRFGIGIVSKCITLKCDTFLARELLKQEVVVYGEFELFYKQLFEE